MATNPIRGEVWRVWFDPAEGDEIKKVRTAAVVSENAVGRQRLKIVAPITEWKPRYASFPWFVHLTPTPANGLSKQFGVDAWKLGELLRDHPDDGPSLALLARTVNCRVEEPVNFDPVWQLPGK